MQGSSASAPSRVGEGCPRFSSFVHNMQLSASGGSDSELTGIYIWTYLTSQKPNMLPHLKKSGSWHRRKRYSLKFSQRNTYIKDCCQNTLRPPFHGWEILLFITEVNSTTPFWKFWNLEVILILSKWAHFHLSYTFFTVLNVNRVLSNRVSRKLYPHFFLHWKKNSLLQRKKFPFDESRLRSFKNLNLHGIRASWRVTVCWPVRRNLLLIIKIIMHGGTHMPS